MTDYVTVTTKIVETQEEIVAAVAESNLRCQLQTASNIFYLPPLKDAFGTYAINKANFNDVIAGSFTPADDANPFAGSLLQALEQPASLKNKGFIDFTITPSAHPQAWKNQKDKTTVEPSALSNSHYICASTLL